jgi:hypothetical protein
MTRTHLDRAFLVALSAFVFTSPIHAQQADIPPVPADAVTEPAEAVGDAQSGRIVDGRPNLYTFKKVVHPFTWIDAGFRPILQGVEKAAAGYLGTSSSEKKPKVSGVRFRLRGIGGGGSNSGIGPEVTPFHNDLFGTGTEAELPLYVSVRLYESYGFRLNYPLARNETLKRLGLELTGRYASRPSESFFGLGNDSDEFNEAKFRSVSRTAGFALEARIKNSWRFRLEEGYRSVGITKPRNFISATDVFEGTGIPGLTDPNVTMLTSTAVLERNTKDRNNLAGSGGLQRFEATLNEALTGGDFSFWRYRAEIQQFVPLEGSKRQVIAFRANAETTQEKGGSIVPFYDLPTVGGSSTVRGFANRRFADKSAVSASLEYRYRIWRHMDWGLFVDTGQVAPKIGDFARERFHTGYGMRLAVRAKGDRAVSFEAARSPEAWMFYVDFTPF